MEKQQVAKPEFRTALISVENGERREREQCCCLFRFSLVPSGWWEKVLYIFLLFFFSLSRLSRPNPVTGTILFSVFFSLTFNDERGELPIISIPFHAAWLENHRNGVMWNNGSCTRCCASLLFVIQVLPHLLTRI